jgi:hypothetical protein
MLGDDQDVSEAMLLVGCLRQSDAAASTQRTKKHHPQDPALCLEDLSQDQLG